MRRNLMKVYVKATVSNMRLGTFRTEQMCLVVNGFMDLKDAAARELEVKHERIEHIEVCEDLKQYAVSPNTKIWL
jgi:hypothetical protein